MTADIIKRAGETSLTGKSNRPVQDFYAETSCQQAYEGLEQHWSMSVHVGYVCSRIMLCNSIEPEGVFTAGLDVLAGIFLSGLMICRPVLFVISGGKTAEDADNHNWCEVIQSIHDGELREEKNDVGRPPDWEGYGKPE